MSPRAEPEHIWSAITAFREPTPPLVRQLRALHDAAPSLGVTEHQRLLAYLTAIGGKLSDTPIDCIANLVPGSLGTAKVSIDVSHQAIRSALSADLSNETILRLQEACRLLAAAWVCQTIPDSPIQFREPELPKELTRWVPAQPSAPIRRR